MDESKFKENISAIEVGTVFSAVKFQAAIWHCSKLKNPKK
ncbi:MAG: hypothetical protein ACI9XR_000090 [Flavobacterium sp.]